MSVWGSEPRLTDSCDRTSAAEAEGQRATGRGGGGRDQSGIAEAWSNSGTSVTPGEAAERREPLHRGSLADSMVVVCCVWLRGSAACFAIVVAVSISVARSIRVAVS